MISIVGHDHAEVGRAGGRRPAVDESVMAVATPECRGEGGGALEDRLEPGLIRDLEAGLDVLLPLRREDARERPDRDHDVHARRIEILDDPTHRLVPGVGEPLAADHHALGAAPADLAQELLPGLDGPSDRVAGPDGGCCLGGSERLAIRAGVVDAMERRGTTRAVERALQRRRAGLVRADVQQTRAVGQQHV